MKVLSGRIRFNTSEEYITNITGEVQQIIKSTGFNDGVVTLFVAGLTGALMTIEYEPGLLYDSCNAWNSRPERDCLLA